MALTLNFKNLTDGKIYKLDAENFITKVMRRKDVWQSLENDIKIIEKFFYEEVSDIIYDYDSEYDYLHLPMEEEVENIVEGKPFVWYIDYPYILEELIEILTEDLNKYIKYI